MNALSPGGFDRPDDSPVPLLGPLGAVEVRLRVEVGAARLTLAELAALGPGATFELDRRSDERVDILINDRVVAKGEIVTIGDRFGVRLLEIVAAA